MTRIRWPAVIAGMLALLVVMLALGAMSCLSLWRARCSATSLIHGREALDVPYAETRPEVVSRMLEMARVGPDDRVIDLGTGDGRILIAAARRGASGTGVDIDPANISTAQAYARSAGVAERVSFRTQDLFETPLREATVVTMFLLPEVNLRLRPRLLSELRPGARIVSHAFDMGEWRADETHRVGGSTIYLWRVPAQAGGRWRLEAPAGEAGELRLEQRFQTISGTFTPAGGGTVRVVHGRLDGTSLQLDIEGPEGPRAYRGRVEAGAIVPLDAAAGWRATRL